MKRSSLEIYLPAGERAAIKRAARTWAREHRETYSVSKFLRWLVADWRARREAKAKGD